METKPKAPKAAKATEKKAARWPDDVKPVMDEGVARHTLTEKDVSRSHWSTAQFEAQGWRLVPHAQRWELVAAT